MNWFEIIQKFIKQAEREDLKTSSYPATFNELKVKVSFGKGSPANVPWIAFLDESLEVRQGIYPVYLYFKKFTTLVLCFVISETKSAKKEWPKEIKTSNLKVSEYFHEEVWRYHNSLVFKDYKVILNNNEVKIIHNDKKICKTPFQHHLITIISYYKKLISEDVYDLKNNKKMSFDLIGGDYDDDITKREREILKLYRKGLTLREIGVKFNLSRERIRQLKIRAFKKELVVKSRKNGLNIEVDEYIKNQEELHRKEKNKISKNKKELIKEDLNKKELHKDIWKELSNKHNVSVNKIKKNFPNYVSELKKKIKNRWHPKYSKCKKCGTTEIPFYAKGLCESCHPRGTPRGERREKIIKDKGSRCAICKKERYKVKKDTGRDFYVSDKFSEKKGDYMVYCQECFFSKVGKISGPKEANTNCLFVNGRKITSDIVDSISFKDLKKLSERERSIILMWGQGKLFGEIADIFDVIDLTVRNSIRKSLKKVGKVDK